MVGDSAFRTEPGGVREGQGSYKDDSPTGPWLGPLGDVGVGNVFN